jgi:hypothetical protein
VAGRARSPTRCTCSCRARATWRSPSCLRASASAPTARRRPSGTRASCPCRRCGSARLQNGKQTNKRTSNQPKPQKTNKQPKPQAESPLAGGAVPAPSLRAQCAERALSAVQRVAPRVGLLGRTCLLAARARPAARHSSALGRMSRQQCNGGSDHATNGALWRWPQPGEFFGDVEALNQMPRMYTVRAAAPNTVPPPSPSQPPPPSFPPSRHHRSLRRAECKQARQALFTKALTYGPYSSALISNQHGGPL